jgi:sugar phosphate isomerase/epimerase
MPMGAAAPTPHVKFPSDPRQRIAVASWPFRALLDPKKGSLPLLDFPQMIVDRFGVHAIEPLDLHFPSTDVAYLKKLRAAARKAKVRIVNIPVARAGGSFYSADAASRSKAIDTAKHWVDVAALAGSPSIRAHIATAATPPDVALASASLKQVADYAAAKDIVVHLENDDPRSEEAFFLADVITRVNHPYLRALPDFCNSMLLHRGEPYNDQALTALFAHAYGICHVKDSEQSGGELFRIDLERAFQIAKAAGYRGYFSIEYDAEGDPFQPTRALIEATLGALV